MSEVLVRNLDEAVVEQLKARARGSGRSLQADSSSSWSKQPGRHHRSRHGPSTAPWRIGSAAK